MTAMAIAPRLVAAALVVAGALAVPSAALAARPIRLKFPKTIVVPPNSDLEVCTFVRLPMKQAYDARGQLIVNVGGNGTDFVTHHFLMYAYTGTSMAEFARYEGQLVPSKACLDFGPPDRNQRLLLGGSQSPRVSQRLPRGLAQRIEPNDGAVGIILNSHWINSSSETKKANVKVKFLPARPGTIRRFAKPIFEVVANGFINVAPGSIAQTSWGWSPGRQDLAQGQGGVALPDGPACVTMVTAHMHQRGTRFVVDYEPRGGRPERVFEATDYADPGQRIFTPPLLVSPGDRLRYTCTHDNGVATPVKMGCEEEPGTVPGVGLAGAIFSGIPIGENAARRCTTDADCAGHGTGRCVPANLVFGFTSDDEMCILPGSYYEANPDRPDDPCNLEHMPKIRSARRR
jgi:hypothetical protein